MPAAEEPDDKLLVFHGPALSAAQIDRIVDELDEPGDLADARIQPAKPATH